MSTHKNVIFIPALVLALSSAAVVPTVTTVFPPTQDAATRRLTVSYSLSEPAVVTLEVLTNGQPVAVSYAWGDVNRYVTNTACTASWLPDRDWPDHMLEEGAISARVTAWPTNRLPDYMAVNLIAPSNVRFYASAAVVPGGVTNERWKAEWLLMRKIPAAGVEWGMGLAYGQKAPQTADIPRMANSPQVALSEDYYLGVYEATQGQLKLMSRMIRGNSPFSFSGSLVGDHCATISPAERISYKFLRVGTNDPPFTVNWPVTGHDVLGPTALLREIRDFTGIEFDLPTEAQWEFACRAGTKGLRYADVPLGDLAWYGSNAATNMTDKLKYRTFPVGLKVPNAFGLYDMYGNVAEWCLDWIDGNASYPGSYVVDPVGLSFNTESGSLGRVDRGGSCNQVEQMLSSLRRSKDPSTYTQYSTGFRLCCPVRLPVYLTAQTEGGAE